MDKSLRLTFWPAYNPEYNETNRHQLVQQVLLKIFAHHCTIRYDRRV